MELVNIQGPGMITRFVLINYDTSENGKIRFYIDGNETPAIDCKITKLFDGTMAPFKEPLVGGMEVSSHGSYSYVPICFEKSIRIVADYADFFSFQFKTYPYGTAIKSYTGKEDLTEYMKSFLSPSIDYKDTSRKNEIKTRFQKDYRDETVEQTGIQVTDQSAFKVKIDPDNTGIMIRGLFAGASQMKPVVNDGITLRGTYTGGCDYKANIYVDDEFAGIWRPNNVTEAENTGWEEDFFINGKFTRGKSEVNIRIEVVSGAVWYDIIYDVFTIASMPYGYSTTSSPINSRSVVIMIAATAVSFAAGMIIYGKTGDGSVS